MADETARLTNWPSTIDALRPLARALTLAISLCLLWAVAFPSVSLAASGNAPCRDAATFGSHQFGIKTANGIAGAKAAIEYVNPLLCTNVGGDNDLIKGSFAWVGVEVAGTLRSIVQVGLGKCTYSAYLACDGTLIWWYAWGRDANQPGCGGFLNVDPKPLRISAAATGTHTFEVVRTGTVIQFKVDGVVKEDVPSSAICWTGHDAAYSGETWDRGDQTGDNFPSAQLYSSALYEPGVGQPWTSPAFTTCYRDGYTAEYFCNRPSGQSINVWTDRN